MGWLARGPLHLGIWAILAALALGQSAPEVGSSSQQRQPGQFILPRYGSVSYSDAFCAGLGCLDLRADTSPDSDGNRPPSTDSAFQDPAGERITG